MATRWPTLGPLPVSSSGTRDWHRGGLVWEAAVRTEEEEDGLWRAASCFDGSRLPLHW